MDSNALILLIFLFCAVCFAASAVKKRPTVLLSFLGRSAAGALFIHFFNLACAARDVVTYIGVNPLTLAVSGILGLPGVFLLYASRLCGFL